MARRAARRPAAAPARTARGPAPLSQAEFAALMAPFAAAIGEGPVAVAVSGGADSLALALLAADWARQRGMALVALTVDHRLRVESAAEARQVRRWLAARGIDHRVLAWRGPKPTANLQAGARAARYRLLADECRKRNCDHLLLAHQLEDQAETFLLRAGRGSGVDGLCAMAPAAEAGGLTLLRPLLAVPKARLEATLRAAGQGWIDDPSNRDPRFQRTAARAALGLLAPAGMVARRLADTARRMARVRAALDYHTAALAARAVTVDEGGFCRLDPAALLAEPEEIALRLLARLLMTVGGRALPPRLERLERLLAALREGKLARGRTLHGCRVLPWRDGVLVCREASDIAGPLALAPGASQTWDGRFRVRLGPDAPRGLKVAALGAAPAALAKPLAGLPGPVRPTLPALWRGGRLVAVPRLGYATVESGHDFGLEFLAGRLSAAGAGKSW